MKATSPAKRRTTSTGAASVDPVFEAYWLSLKAATLEQQLATAKSLAKAVKLKSAKASLLGNDALAATRVAREILLTSASDAVVSSADAWEAARALKKSPLVDNAEPLFATAGLQPDPKHLNHLLAPHERTSRAAKSGGAKPALPCAATNPLWHLELINAPQAWLLKPSPGGLRFGEGIVVGHPDTGYTQHGEVWDAGLASSRRLRPELGYNFEEGVADPTDPMSGTFPGHGTGTASVIMSGRGGPGTPFVTGSAPESRLVPIRVSDSVIHWSFKNAIQSIYHATDKAGAHIISMSLGGPVHSSAFESAIAYAISKGVIVLAAAGNVWPFVVYPARFESVIAVAACNCLRKPWKDSARGDAVDITAPGESVWRACSQLKNGKLSYTVAPGSGTSYAVATLAGACANWLAFHGRDALLARYGAARLAGVFKQLLTTAGCVPPTGWDKKKYGAGLLDLQRLLAAPLPPAGKAKKSAAAKANGAVSASGQIAGYFPDVPKATAKRGVSRILASKRSSISSKGKSTSVGDELAFHVATNAELRAAIRRQLMAGTKKSTKKSTGTSPLVSLMKSPSPALRALLSNEST